MCKVVDNLFSLVYPTVDLVCQWTLYMETYRYCIVLYCTWKNTVIVLYCTWKHAVIVLYCIVHGNIPLLYCIVLYCIVLYIETYRYYIV